MKDFILKLIAVIIAGICTGIAVFFGWKIYQQEMMYKEGDETYEMIERIAQAAPNEEEVPVNRPEPSLFEPESSEPISDAEEPNEPPEPEETIPVAEIDFAALKEVNSDVVAWICCPDTVINRIQFCPRHQFSGAGGQGADCYYQASRRRGNTD